MDHLEFLRQAGRKGGSQNTPKQHLARIANGAKSKGRPKKVVDAPLKP